MRGYSHEVCDLYIEASVLDFKQVEYFLRS